MVTSQFTQEIIYTNVAELLPILNKINAYNPQGGMPAIIDVQNKTSQKIVTITFAVVNVPQI